MSDFQGAPLVPRLALVLVSAAGALAFAAPAQATLRSCQGVVDADCFYGTQHCLVWFGFTPSAPLPPLCL
jgi:hypothetical protein